jgi:hypothetical protein
MISDTGPRLFVSVDIVQEIAVVYKVSQGLVGSAGFEPATFGYKVKCLTP